MSTLLENVLKKLKHKHQIAGANRYFAQYRNYEGIMFLGNLNKPVIWYLL